MSLERERLANPVLTRVALLSYLSIFFTKTRGFSVVIPESLLHKTSVDFYDAEYLNHKAFNALDATKLFKEASNDIKW